MIPNETQLRAEYQKAPKLVKEFITSAELNQAFTEIRDEHQLHLDEAGTLSNALNAVFLELVPLEKFPELLKEVVKDEAKRTAVLKDINEKVFVAFRKKLEGPREDTAPVRQIVNPPARAIQAPERPAAFNEIETEAPQITTAPVATPAINKLEQSVRQKATDVELDTTPKPPQSGTQENKPNYRGSDPYREPIE